jgi:hypothetical protein
MVVLDLFAPSLIPAFVIPAATAQVAVAITAGAWAFVFLRLLWTSVGRRFLARSLPVRRATLTATEQPNTLTVAALVLAAVVFLPTETAVRVTSMLMGSLILLIASWAVGNSARYRMGALLFSEGLFWLGLTLLAAAIAKLAEPLLSSARNAALLLTVLLAAYGISIAVGTLKTANRWAKRSRRSRERQTADAVRT